MARETTESGSEIEIDESGDVTVTFSMAGPTPPADDTERTA